jgi:nicotinate-nucleotide adenylyltransferase
MVRAVLGGSFDPVHDGHVAIGAHLLEQGLADHLVVIPADRSPHKDACLAGPADRLAMCRLAFAGLERCEVDDREIVRGGTSYTVDTLRELGAEHPAADLLLALGSDNVAGFASWKDPAGIVSAARLVVYPRGGRTPSLEDCERAGMPRDRVTLVTGFDHPVSSTAVRAMLRDGRLPETGLHPDVAAHIRSRHLYGI